MEKKNTFTQWLPGSDYTHARAPEMEVYPPGKDGPEVLCEFWLPVIKKGIFSQGEKR